MLRLLAILTLLSSSIVYAETLKSTFTLHADYYDNANNNNDGEFDVSCKGFVERDLSAGHIEANGKSFPCVSVDLSQLRRRVALEYSCRVTTDVYFSLLNETADHNPAYDKTVAVLKSYFANTPSETTVLVPIGYQIRIDDPMGAISGYSPTYREPVQDEQAVNFYYMEFQAKP